MVIDFQALLHQATRAFPGTIGFPLPSLAGKNYLVTEWLPPVEQRVPASESACEGVCLQETCTSDRPGQAPGDMEWAATEE